MARIATGDHYQLAVINGVGQAVGKTVPLPSVTTILKAVSKGGLEWWGYKMGLLEARRLAKNGDTAIGMMSDDHFYDFVKDLGRKGEAQTPSSALKTAGARGTNIHDIAESFFKEGRVPGPAEVPEQHHGYVKALASFITWLGDYELITAETPLFSLDHRYAGTVDLVLQQGDRYVVADFKTSKAIYETHLLQATAYAHAAQEMGLVPPQGPVEAWVVRLGADGTYEVKKSNCAIEDFLGVKKAWEWQQRMKEAAVDGV